MEELDPNEAAKELAQELDAQKDRDRKRQIARRFKISRKPAKRQRDPYDIAWRRAFFWTMLTIPFLLIPFLIFQYVGFFNMSAKHEAEHMTGRGYIRGSLLGLFAGFLLYLSLIMSWVLYENAKEKVDAAAGERSRIALIQKRQIAEEEARIDNIRREQEEARRRAARRQEQEEADRLFQIERQKAVAEVEQRRRAADARPRPVEDVVGLNREPPATPQPEELGGYDRPQAKPPAEAKLIEQLNKPTPEAPKKKARYVYTMKDGTIYPAETRMVSGDEIILKTLDGKIQKIKAADVDTVDEPKP